MTYTREQIKGLIRAALSGQLKEAFALTDSADLAVYAAFRLAQLAADMLDRLDHEMPEPQPTETKDEEIRLFSPPQFNPDVDPDYTLCTRCWMYRCNHRRCGDLMVCTRPR